MKCPICDSSRFTEGPKGKTCQRCGYTNKPMKTLEIEELNRDLVLEKL